MNYYRKAINKVVDEVIMKQKSLDWDYFTEKGVLAI